MSFTVEPSPAGGYHVRMVGSAAPLSHHDTLEEAEARLAAYRRGLAERGHGELVDLPDGSEVRLRPVRPEDKPLFAAGWEAFGESSRYRRFMMPKQHLEPDDLEFLTEVDHVDHEAIGAVDPRTGAGLGVARYVRHAERPDAAEAAVAVIDDVAGPRARRAAAPPSHRPRDGERHHHVHGLDADREPQHAAPVRAARRVHVREVGGGAMEIDVELPVGDARTLLRSTATGHVHS